MASRSSRYRLPLILALGGMLIAFLGGLGPATAGGAVKTFRPVDRAAKTIVFKLRGLPPKQVKRASIRLRRNGRTIQRKVRVGRVRRALRRGNRIRLKKSLRSRGGRLVVRLANAPTPTPSCAGPFSASNLPGACWRPYSAASPFNTPLASRQAAADSQQVVGRTMGFGQMDKISGGVADTEDDWSHPIYFSEASDPLFTVHCTYSSSWGPCEVEGASLRIPNAARPAGGGDGHMAVIDQASGWEYDFWQVQQKPAGGGTLTVSYGGKTRIDSDGLGSNATAANFGLAAGVIRPSELEAGQIEHALFMVVECTNGTAVWPAPSTGTGRSCSSIGLSDADAPAMGQRFFLDMDAAQIDALPNPAWQKTILHAMAEYGLYVGDTGGSAWGIAIESGSSFTSFGYEDPWARLGRQYEVPTWDGAPDGKRRYIFDLRTAVDWASALKVAAG
jgi:hypothetical protein